MAFTSELGVSEERLGFCEAPGAALFLGFLAVRDLGVSEGRLLVCVNCVIIPPQPVSREGSGGTRGLRRQVRCVECLSLCGLCHPSSACEGWGPPDAQRDGDRERGEAEAPGGRGARCGIIFRVFGF